MTQLDIVIAAGILIAFLIFPPLENPLTPAFGLSDAAIRHLLPDLWRVALYGVLSMAALLRFLREPLPCS